MSDAANSPVRYQMVEQPHAPHTADAGHHDDVPGTQPESIKAGHEADRFYARGVILVPILVIVAAGITYGVVTMLFGYFSPGKPNSKGANLQAEERNARPYNERVSDISSQNPNAEVKQPRLEFMRTIDSRPGEPPFYRSFKQPDQGNAPEIRPEYLRPENFIDWNTGEKPLVTYKWLDKNKGVARIPIEMAIEILSHDKKLPSRTGEATKTTNAKFSNGGQGFTPAPAPKPAEAPKHDDHKH